MRIKGELSRFITPIVLILILSLMLLPGSKEGLEKVRQIKQGKRPKIETPIEENAIKAASTPYFLGLTQADKHRLNFGANPERRILQALAAEHALLTEVATGKEKPRWLLEESLVLNNQWVLATYASGQLTSQVLLAFSIEGTGQEAKFSWQLVAD